MDYKGPGLYGLNPPLWVSGATIAKGQWVTSPADNEIYQRIAATGGGTTDPADDVTNYVARSYVRTVALPNVNAFNASAAISTSTLARGATRISLPAISTGARTSVLSVTGKGNIDYLALNKAASDSMLIEVICDGRTIYSQDPGLNNVNGVALVIGVFGPNADHSILPSIAVFDRFGVEFRRSLQVFVTPATSALPAGSVMAYHVRSLG